MGEYADEIVDRMCFGRRSSGRVAPYKPPKQVADVDDFPDLEDEPETEDPAEGLV